MAKKQEDKYKPRADGRYHTQVSTGKYDDNGRSIRIPLYAKSSKELEKLVNDTKYELEHGTFAHDKGLTFGEYAEKWFEVSKASKSINTKNMYKNILANHIDYLENKKLKNITKSDIQLQINKNIDMPRICQIQRLTIKQIMETAVDDGLIIKNPCKDIELPRRVVKESRPLTEVEKKALKMADFTPMEKAFVYILYGCGLRPGELYALTRSDINFTASEITINKALAFERNKPIVVYPKTNSGIRTIQAPSLVFDALKAYLSNSPNLILFCDTNGEYRARTSYTSIFKKIVKKMKDAAGNKNENKISEINDKKIDGLTQYVFRHNYCTELYYSGISLKEAQRHDVM